MYGKPCDLWSLGAVLYIMHESKISIIDLFRLSGQAAFDNDEDEERGHETPGQN